ncbi:MAG: hypothetical protein Q4Q37_05010 [Methanobrevibacter sp.]|nr:hypothetical protein [Methanobrevibacter sp.]
MSNEKPSHNGIIEKLTPIEKKILLECGKMNISIKKNVREETIKKKMPDAYLKDFNKSIKNLIAMGLLVVYRPHNYGLSKEGRLISKRIKESYQSDFYSNLKILMIVE